MNIIQSFLIVYTNCKQPRNSRGHSYRAQAVIRSVEGLDLHEDSDNDCGTFKKDEGDEKYLKKSKVSLFDLIKSIQFMTALFPDSGRPTIKVDETFTSRLTHITEQAKTLDIDASHQPSVPFSLLPPSTPAPNACIKTQLKSIKIDVMASEVKRKVLFDGEIKDRRATRWNSMTYEQFRKATDCNKTATRKCLEFMIEYQKGLPNHILALAHLYNRLRSIYCSVTWCETLFQRTEAHEDPHVFGQKLIFAAANQDLRSKSWPKKFVLYHATRPSASSAGSSDLLHLELVAFSSKTLPLPRRRRPLCSQIGQPLLRGSNFGQCGPHFKHFWRPYGMRLSDVSNSHFRKPKVCY